MHSECLLNSLIAFSFCSLAADAHNGEVEYYIAAYPYQSSESGDLSFNAGEMVMVIKKEGDWWTGTIGTRTGMFPSNYVQKADVGTASADVSAEIANAFDDQKVSSCKWFLRFKIYFVNC